MARLIDSFICDCFQVRDKYISVETSQVFKRAQTNCCYSFEN